MPITDLTNTTWLLNDEINTRNTRVYSINFTSNNTNYNELNWSYDSDDDFFYMYYVNTTLTNVYVFSGSAYWTNDAYKTITITGGTDATNTDLISWLEANATQQQTPTFYNSIFMGDSNIVGVYVGESDVSTMYLGDEKIYEKLAPAPSGYSVTCSFTETDVSMKSYVKIYDGQDNTGTLLFESTTATATPTTTITCSSGYLFIYVGGSDPYTSYTSVTGGVTIYDESTYLGSRTFAVSGDGTISMTISYDG